MKNKKYNSKIYFLIVSTLLFLMGCNETLTQDELDLNPPIITQISPLSGNVGMEVVIKGDNLLRLDSVYIGSGRVIVKHLINKNEAIVVVTNQATTGKVTLFNTFGKVESSETFTISYLVPQLKTSTLPTKAKVNDNIIIEGQNLDAVIDVYFGTQKAQIKERSATELLVEVPYFEDSTIDILLAYITQTGEKRTGTTNKPFSLDMPMPTITNYPTSAETGVSITLTGENLTLIDKVIFGTIEAAISDKSDNSITVEVPSGFPSTQDVALKLIYYVNKELVVTPTFQIVVPQFNYWPNITIYANDPSTNDNFFDPTTGSVYTPCSYSSNVGNIYFYLTITSSSLAFNNPLNGVNQIKNFKCGTASLPADVTGALNVKFRRLDPTNTADNMFIGKVKNKTLTTLSQSELDQEGVAPAKTSSMRHNGISGDPNNMYVAGDVILFQRLNGQVSDSNAPIVSVGLIEIVKITSTNPQTDKKSSVTFNCYFQK